MKYFLNMPIQYRDNREHDEESLWHKSRDTKTHCELINVRHVFMNSTGHNKALGTKHFNNPEWPSLLGLKIEE